jgi:hypothetical protein
MVDYEKLSGIVTTSIALILSIGAITISGIDFQVLNVNWNNSPWRHLGLLQLVSTIYAAVISIFGIFIYTVLSDKKPLLITVN